LARHYVVPHISTGDMLRSAVADGTEFGRKAQEYMDAGELLPDDIMIGVVAERLDHDDTKRRGYILDGFPRTVGQAEALAEIAVDSPLELAVNLDVPADVVMHRLAGRRVCVDCGANYSVDVPPRYDWTCDICGGRVVQRADDTEEAIARRLALYEQETAPLIEWYDSRGLLATVDGLGSADEVTDRLVQMIDGRHSRFGVQNVGEH
jgi:adenylate kinase